MRSYRRVTLLWAMILLLLPLLSSSRNYRPFVSSLIGGFCLADRLPIEPEKDNSEYIIDLETNFYNRLWREIWDEEDNRLRFRIGSNNVRDWFIEEELKFAARLSSKLRFRYYHGRLLRYTSDRHSFDIFEFEGNVTREVFLSIYAKPTFSKPENTIGFMLQNRKAINHYFILFVEFPHFLRNYTESHSDPQSDIGIVFDRNPIRVGVNVRERLYPNIWLRLQASTTNTFLIRNEVVATGERYGGEEGKLTYIDGYLEYVFNPDAPLEVQSAAGVEGGYRKRDKIKETLASALPLFVNVDTPKCSNPDWAAARIQEGGDETNPYTPTEEDSVRWWLEENRFARPFGWIALTDRTIIHAALRFEKRRIMWRNSEIEEAEITNWYTVPSIGCRYGLGSQKASIVETGFIAQFRKREVELRDGAVTVTSRVDERFRDHRIYLAFEYHFAPDKSVRIIEAIDLDREDWGQYSIHDHGFLQMQFGF